MISHTQVVMFQIRGMSIDEALKQLSFVERKGSAVVKEVSRFTAFSFSPLSLGIINVFTI